MLRVLVLDKKLEPLMPCHSARARKLIKLGKAKVYRLKPFTIILTERNDGDTQTTELKIDPGSKETGIALVSNTRSGKKVTFALNLEHRGRQIKDALGQRRAIRRSRRNRKTRYRPPRFDNRTRPTGWLPPSLVSRVENVRNWAAKLQTLTPIHEVAVETVRFDTQKLRNPEIKGVEYQQGELFGYEVREYLLEKWSRTCSYCEKKDIPLEVEHIIPKSRGGANAISNLTLACRPCNQAKGNRPVEEFLGEGKRLQAIRRQAKAPLADAAAVNATRYATGRALKSLGLPTAFWTGGRTKYNRMRQGLPKDHWIDAACVGETGEDVFIPKNFTPLLVKAEGRGSRQKCRVNRFGFPRTGPKSSKRVYGFQTGDRVRAFVPKGTKQGTWTGRVAVRANGYFNIKLGDRSTIQGISHKYCQLLQRIDGYSYSTSRRTTKTDSDASHRFSPKGVSIPPRPEGRGIQETF